MNIIGGESHINIKPVGGLMITATALMNHVKTVIGIILGIWLTKHYFTIKSNYTQNRPKDKQKQ